MSTPATTAHAPVGTDHRAVPAQARQLAARLSALFDRDVEIVKRLNDAHQRLANANQQLDARTASDTLTPPDIRWRIHHAFCAYQDAAERRRQLAVDVGEIAQQLTDALTQAGWTAQQARRANVHQLAEPSRARVGNFHDREWGFPVIVDSIRVPLGRPSPRGRARAAGRDPAGTRRRETRSAAARVERRR